MRLYMYRGIVPKAPSNIAAAAIVFFLSNCVSFFCCVFELLLLMLLMLRVLRLLLLLLLVFDVVVVFLVFLIW